MNEETCEFNSYHSYYRHDVSTNHYWYDIFSEWSVREITDMIANPMEHNRELRKISRRLYSSNGLARNTIDYISAMPTLDYVITDYIKEKNDIKKEKFRYVLDLIKHEEFMRDAILKGCIDGVAFYYFDSNKRPLNKSKTMSQWDVDGIREINSAKSDFSNINASIVSLPVDYCKIVGIKNNNYVLAFNLEYFTIGNESADSKKRKYPKEIRMAYEKWKSGKGKQWAVLDNTKTIVHKISSNRDEPWGRPLVLAAILDILYSDYFTNTKRNMLDNLNNQIIYQTFPQGKEAGTSALTQKQQSNQHDAVKSAVTNKNSYGGISFFSVAAGTKIDSLDVNTDLFDDDIESDLDTKIGTALGFAASLLSASGTTSFSAQQTNLELVTAQIFQWIDQISAELNKVINFNILKNEFVNTKVNYLPITHINKNNMINNAKDLYLMGKGSLLLWAAACGIPSDVFKSMVEYELKEDFENKYPVHQTSYTQSSKTNSSDGGESKSGRPTVEETGQTITNENTVKSRTNNSNNVVRPNS